MDGDLSVTRACPAPGITVEIIDYILAKMRVPYITRLLNVTEGDYGRPAGDTWTGVAKCSLLGALFFLGYLGAVHEGVVDTVVADTSLNAERQSQFSFSSVTLRFSACEVGKLQVAVHYRQCCRAGACQ